jgi:hypothetical protein
MFQYMYYNMIYVEVWKLKEACIYNVHVFCCKRNFSEKEVFKNMLCKDERTTQILLSMNCLIIEDIKSTKCFNLLMFVNLY